MIIQLPQKSSMFTTFFVLSLFMHGPLMKSIYKDSITITVVNNQLGRVFQDRRGSLRQGGCASMEWFSFGIDPLLRYLDRRLQGILISSLPVLGPASKDDRYPLPPLEERFKLMAYCEDVKPGISTMAEFTTVDQACSLFEQSSAPPRSSTRQVQVPETGKVERHSQSGRYPFKIFGAL